MLIPVVECLTMQMQKLMSSRCDYDRQAVLVSTSHALHKLFVFCYYDAVWSDDQ